MKYSNSSSYLLSCCKNTLEDASLPKDGVLLATVSGGADSVALLHALVLCGRRVVVANCNFHLRGEESNRDSMFVVALCEKLGIELVQRDFDVETFMSSSRGISVEMACRELRHQWFDKMAVATGSVAIATGHNASDNAETMMLNLLRGSGVAGLKGMMPYDGRIIRPLLEVSRREILVFLEELGERYVTDSTNLESDYRRNFIRNDVFPMIRSRWLGMDRALMRSLRVLRREYVILQSVMEKALEGVGDLLPWNKINSFPDPETLVFYFIRERGGTPEIAAEIVRSLPRPTTGKHWIFCNSCVRATRKGLKLSIK